MMRLKIQPGMLYFFGGILLDQTAQHVGLGSQETQKLHHCLSTATDPSQHVVLFRSVQDKDKIINRIYLDFSLLNQGCESVRDVINQSIINPFRRNQDEIFELMNTTSDILRMRKCVKTELESVTIIL